MPAFAVVPVAEWNVLLAKLDEFQEITEAKSAQAPETLPAEVANAFWKASRRSMSRAPIED